MMAHLPPAACPMPECGVPMESRSFTANGRGAAPTASDYDGCLRQCPACGVGFSNARETPTLIHRDPMMAIPPEVRIGASDALAAALNVRNRPSKFAKFGFSTSEDAVTWTVFSYLHVQHQAALSGLYERVFGIQAVAPPTLLLWGVQVPGGLGESALVQRIVEVSDLLGEAAISRSEPDVVLDFGPGGVVLVEVKYLSGNSGTTDPSKFDRYVDGSVAFTRPVDVKGSGLYELARNWRIAHDLAAGRPFVLANLAMDATLNSTPGLTRFVTGLTTTERQRFLPLRWRDFLTAARDFTGGFPLWLEDYCGARGLL